MKAVITCAIVMAALVAWASPAKAQGCDPIRVGEGTIIPQICGLVWSDNGDGMPASSDAWQNIADAHEDLDDYNNGRLCAPHRK
jgi:hypothetical protein